AHFLPQILELCDRVAKLVAEATRAGRTPLVLGGDHSVALGTLVGMAGVHGPGGVVWIDAHGDLNTPATSPSGNVHGMVLAAALGLAGDSFKRDGWPLPAVEPGKLALVGVRSLDDGERELLRTLDAKIFTMSEVDRIGVEPCMREAIAHAAGAAFLPPSLDLDDIAAVEADAIANAANDRLWMGAGVAGALKRAGGDEIEQEAMAIGGIPLGTAVATTAGRLRARWVVHGAVMGQDLRTDADLVGR